MLARELGLCYATLALVTDDDSDVEGARPVAQAEVFAFFEENVHRLRDLLVTALVEVPAERACACATGGHGLEPLPPDGDDR